MTTDLAREDHHAHDAPAAAGDNGYFILVGGLLLMISLTLGYLWQAERARRMTAEGRIAALELRMAEMDRELIRARASSAFGGKGPKTFTLPPGVPLESVLQDMVPSRKPKAPG